MRNKIIAFAFLVLIVGTGLYLNCFRIIASTCRTLFTKAVSFDYSVDDDEASSMTSQFAAVMEKKNENILDEFPLKTTMIDVNGSILKAANVRSYYNLSHGMNMTTNGYNINRYDSTSTDYEVAQMVSFKQYLDSKGINLLYVSQPAKYIDDGFYAEQFGGESYANRNTDLFLSRISEAGIDYLDLRDNIVVEGMEPLSLFYRTDHHWTVPTSEWAAAKISEKLNADCGYSINLQLFDTASFHCKEYKDAWLGEQGKLMSKEYIGLDDYMMMEPMYPTSYTVYAPDNRILLEGDFGIFIDKTKYNTDMDPYAAPSWHYSYSAHENKRIHNNNVDYGNVLVLGDSYGSSMIPFLSLAVQNITLIIPRSLKGSVRDYIENGEYDTVIIAYAQFMIGAHDRHDSANYKMFTLD